MKGIRIIGTGRRVPSETVTNHDLARLVDTSDEWIVSRTGIRRRHRLSGGESHTALCAGAARDALASAGVEPGQIGVCLVATLTPDTLVPSAACRLQAELGLPEDTLCMDLNAACSGFLFALHTAQCLLNASPRPYALVLGAEVLSRVVDWTDRSTCILFGDGAGAAVAECRADLPPMAADLGARGDAGILRLAGPGTGQPPLLGMDGTRVFKFAVETVPRCMDRVLEQAGLTAEQVDFFLLHQANARIIDLVTRKYHIPPEKTYQNIAEYGNTSAASIPLALSELRDQGRLPPGSRALVVGFGGGLTWGGALVEFG